jgi:hypothetical protein
MKALYLYRDALDLNSEEAFQRVNEVISPLPDENINKNRFCTAAYSHLHDIALNRRDIVKSNGYLDGQTRCSAKYLERTSYASRSELIGANNLASALIAGGSDAQLDKAEGILHDEIAKFPNEHTLWIPAAARYSSMKASSLWCAGISWRLPPFSWRRTHQRLPAG